MSGFSPSSGYNNPRAVLVQYGGQEGGDALRLGVLLRFFQFLRPFWKRMVLAVCLMIVATGCALLAPYLIKIAIDEHIQFGNTGGLARTAAFILLTFVGVYLAASARDYCLGWVGQRMLLAIRNRLFRHLQRYSLRYHDTHIVGATISCVINDVTIINQLLSQGLVTAVGDVFLLSGTVAVMVALNAPLALAAFCVLPIMLLATLLFTRHAKIAFRNTRVRIAAFIGNLAESISSMRVIQAFTQEEATKKKFRRLNRENRDANISAMSLSFIYIPSVEFIGMLAMAVVLLFGGIGVARRQVSLGILVAFLSYVTRFFQPIQQLSQLYTTLQAALAGGERVLRLLDTVPEVRDAPHPIELSSLDGRIEFRAVSFSYTSDVEVLHDIDFEILPGQTAAFVGPTGAGKTTIVNLIARFYDATEGQVTIDGHDVRTISQHSLRSRMGIVNQDPFLFSGTLRDNIAFSNPNGAQTDLEIAARIARAHAFIDHLPKGYDTNVFEGGANFSIGQKQLVTISRALFADPGILIMDEATSSVDTVTETLIQEALHELLAHRTAVVVAHRLSTVREADVIFVVDEGRIVERGTHQQLLQRSDLYNELYTRQFIRQ